MGEIRYHPITREAVILSTARADRPGAWSDDAPRDEKDACPFCPGHEGETPPEIERVGEDVWTSRAVPNKYPAIFHPSRPAHEVLIDSPEHDRPFEAMTADDVRRAVELWMRRARAQAEIPARRFVAVFRNEGRAAGQSIAHPHSQILGLDAVPVRVARELDAFQSGACPMCVHVEHERRASERIVDQRGGLLLLSPEAARVPFEMWITPITHEHDWTAADPSSLGELLLSAVRRLRSIHEGAPFNLGFVTAPLRVPDAESFHWRAEITPRLTNLAGFELSTGGWINIESPERAARRLRECAVRQD